VDSLAWPKQWKKNIRFESWKLEWKRPLMRTKYRRDDNIKVDLEEQDVKMWTWLIWLRHLWEKLWTFRSHKCWVISWSDKRLSIFQELWTILSVPKNWTGTRAYALKFLVECALLELKYLNSGNIINLEEVRSQTFHVNNLLLYFN
jgi:hypothetical protein